MNASEYGLLQYDMEWLKTNGFSVSVVPANSGYHEDSLLLYKQGKMVAECSSFESAVSFARGYQKAMDKFRWEMPPTEGGTCRSFIAAHATETGFRSEGEVLSWINNQAEPERWRVAVMSWKEKEQ